MTGMDRMTGKTMEGAAHIAQSIGDILTTPLASCVMRRDYGSRLADLIDAPLNDTTRQLIAAASAGAIARWEPRITLSRVQVGLDGANGRLSLTVEGQRNDTPNPEQISLLIAL